MAENSKIGWTHHTQNFWWGCHRVSRECDQCYIKGIMKRAGVEPFGGPIRTSASLWRKAFRFDRLAQEAGERHRIFTCSMSDFFHPGADAWRGEAWEVIRQCQNVDWLILTKRPKLINDRLPPDWGDGWPNVWLGTTCGIQSSMPRVEQLCKIPARVRFVSAEPLVGPVHFGPIMKQLDWVITGCEKASPEKRTWMDPAWVLDIDLECRAAGVAHFHKQRYQTDRNGREFGVPVTDGLLIDSRVAQKFPTLAETNSR